MAQRSPTLRIVVLCAAALAVCVPALSTMGCGLSPTAPTFTATPSPTSTPTTTPTAIPTPTPTATPTEVPLAAQVIIEPNPIAQGSLGTLVVQPNRPVSVTANLDGESLPLFEEDGKWYGLIGVWAAALPTSQPVVVDLADKNSGLRVIERSELRISEREFELEAIYMPQPVLDLILDAHTAHEEAVLITDLITPHTAQRLWSGTFLQPVEGAVSSAYGARRSYNDGSVFEQHAGLDLAATEGTPVVATNSGRVVFAGSLTVRGNAVIIDHGWGLYSGYYHLSRVGVAEGQSVDRGETIGLVGSTGFSTGPHLHWTIWAGRQPVDPVLFLAWALPQ